ncbi:hypothetical protein PUN28_007649 [Cardiocondyla obscurior]|uniref:Uncharacterized protein n=1 Tax=Cardiocondyla obscurior TaxID=286306 RepID=A0AAW2G6Q8_9HYME
MQRHEERHKISGVSLVHLVEYLVEISDHLAEGFIFAHVCMISGLACTLAPETPVRWFISQSISPPMIPFNWLYRVVKARGKVCPRNISLRVFWTSDQLQNAKAVKKKNKNYFKSIKLISKHFSTRQQEVTRFLAVQGVREFKKKKKKKKRKKKKTTPSFRYLFFCDNLSGKAFYQDKRIGATFQKSFLFHYDRSYELHIKFVTKNLMEVIVLKTTGVSDVRAKIKCSARINVQWKGLTRSTSFGAGE